MTNTATAAANWVNYVLHGEAKDMRANSCLGCGNAFYSYSTEIARYEGGKFVVNVDKYSPTTSKHQSYLANAIARYGNGAAVENEHGRDYRRPYGWRAAYV